MSASLPSSATATILCGHRGTSMRPSLSPLDLLEVEPYRDGIIACGDVILFRPEGFEDPVVHRVVAVGPDGVRTRGDNSPRVDPWLLRRDQIEGRVVAACRGDRRREIHGDRRGRWRGRGARLQNGIDLRLRDLLRPAYRALEARLRGGWQAALLRPRVIELRVRGELRFDLLVGSRRVGTFDPARGAWWIRPPFRLLVDEQQLPHPDRAWRQ